MRQRLKRSDIGTNDLKPDWRPFDMQCYEIMKSFVLHLSQIFYCLGYKNVCCQKSQ